MLAWFRLGSVESYVAMNVIKSSLTGIDQMIIDVVASGMLVARTRSMVGRKGEKEE